MKKQKIAKWISLVLIGAFLLSSCGLTGDTKDGNGSATEPVSEPTTAPQASEEPTELATGTPELTADGVYPVAFASYQLPSYELPAAYSGGYSLPLSSAQVENLTDFTFSESQLQALLQNGFVVTPPIIDPNRMYQEFYQAYESLRYENTPVFVSTDAVFHVYHLIFDKMLRDLERNSFISTLKKLTSAMVIESTNQYDSLKGTDLETAAGKNVAYFGVAARLLNQSVELPPELVDLVDAEVALINAGSGIASSPIWNDPALPQDEALLEDYTQYIPRGHYTRDEALQSYFKAMMWYGRMTFRLKEPLETQRALLVVQAIRKAATTSGNPALSLWQRVYDPTVFIVGKADDLSIYEYGKLSDEIYGAMPDLKDFADNEKLSRFQDAAKKLPPPQINSMWVYIWQDRDEMTQGFRFMGQRFTLDAYVFGELMWRKVGTLENPRDLPKSLDFLAAQGSEEAYRLLAEMGETSYENYDTQLEKVRTEIAGFGQDSWTQNLYWSWLYSLQPIFAPKGEEYPPFMRTQAWLHKDMQTALSSWTELKHDTILYAKQVMAEMGGGDAGEPPKGYVEPNPEAYARLLALTEMTRNGLDSRGLLDEITRGNLDNLIEELNFLFQVAQTELKGQPLTDEEYWRIQYFGGWLESMTIAAADPAESFEGRGYLEDQKSALVADVATGIGRVLEEGVGYPTTIYVVTPLKPYQIAVGAVYTYYEFTVPPDGRLTDEAWQSMLESGNAPAAPDWTSSFIIP